MNLASVIDAAIEAPVFPSFTSIGYDARRRLDSWTDLNDYDVTGRVMVVTGGTSGLGRAAADQLARCGARLILIGRDLERTAGVCAELTRTTNNPDIEAVAADMGDLDQVRKACDEIVARTSRLDVLLHNAGALSDERRTAPSGIEATVASQVVGPHLMTTLLLDRLRGDPPGRVLTMSSGGMYTAGLTVRSLQMDESSYKGAEQYARAKRAQVTLNEMWAERIDATEVRVQCPASRLGRHARRRSGAADLPQGARTGPAQPCRGRRHRRVAGRRRRRPGARQRRLLARPSRALDPQAAHDPQDRHARTSRRAVGLGGDTDSKALRG